MWQPAVLMRAPEFVLIAKPPGMETVSQTGGPALLPCAREQTGIADLRPAHRLDRDTSGVQLFAIGARAEEELTALFRRREVHKTYLAFTAGVPRNRTGTINRPLSKWSGGRRPVRVLRQGGLEASTTYTVLARGAPLPGGCVPGLLAMAPRQGRTHQIRVHAASLGYPILGDDQYGDREINKQAKDVCGLRRQALHAWRLEFAWRGQTVCVHCPLPPDLEALHNVVYGGAPIELPA